MLPGEDEQKVEGGLKRVLSLGGPIRIREENKWIYGLDSRQNLSKEKLFGITGPMHIGMPYKREMALGSVESDTKADLVRELQDKGLTREEAVSTIKDLLREGSLVEIWDPDLKQKVLVFSS